jgi:hypothetical protein
MALINNLYVFVEDENLNEDVESTTHPVEKGSNITDHTQRMPVQLSISGKIVDVKGQKASDILSKIKQLKNSGSLITYSGRNALSNMQIQSFSTSHPNTNWGGCNFDMTLKEVRIAKPAYTAQKKKNSGGTQQVDKGENKNVYHTVKKGDCIWNLVTKQYKSLEPKYSKIMDKCNWVLKQNPSAFSRKGDFTTLQIGKKILIGYRK